jgi:hypothetical protein
MLWYTLTIIRNYCTSYTYVQYNTNAITQHNNCLHRAVYHICEITYRAHSTINYLFYPDGAELDNIHVYLLRRLCLPPMERINKFHRIYASILHRDVALLLFSASGSENTVHNFFKVCRSTCTILGAIYQECTSMLTMITILFK